MFVPAGIEKLPLHPIRRKKDIIIRGFPRPKGVFYNGRKEKR